MSEQYTTTADDFEFFKAECQRYIELFGLKDWSVHYDHTPGIGGGNPLAECEAASHSRTAILRLCPQWDYSTPTRKGISTVAFHEVLEMMFTPFKQKGLDTDIVYAQKEHDIGMESHIIIKRMENVVFPMLFNDDHGTE